MTRFQGSSVGCWNTIPTSARGPSMVRPARARRPSAGRSRPVTSFSSVDLPQPDGPSTDTNSPGSTPNDSCCSAVSGPRLVG